MNLPLVRQTGSPRDQGLEHGRQLAGDINHNLHVYFNRFEKEARIPRDIVLEWSSRYLDVIRRTSPAYAEGMEGIANGADIDLLHITALNIRYELLYYGFGRIALSENDTTSSDNPGDGCTAFAFLPQATRDGHLIHGQNWDWIPQIRGAVLHVTEPDGTRILSFTEAGIFGGKIGINSHHVGLTINGMTTTEDNLERLQSPVHVRCYDILHARNLTDAVSVVTGTPRSCSTNFMVSAPPEGGPAGVVDIEAAPDTHRLIEPVQDRIFHTNHFLDPDSLGIVEPPKKRPNTYSRLERIHHLLGTGTVTPERLKSTLADHDNTPYAICRHEAMQDPPQERYITVTAVIMEPGTGRISLTNGQPCRNPFVSHSIDV